MAPPSVGIIGDTCQSDNNCSSSLICQNTICKAKIGSSCNMLQDCVSSATACTKMTKICSAQPLPGSGEMCSNLPCQAGLSCQDNICKSQTGGSSQDNDGFLIDTGGSLSANISSGEPLNNISSLPDPPNTSLFDYCTNNQECISGLCGDSKLISEVSPGRIELVHRFPHSLMDVIQEGDNTLMLLGDGNIMREIYSHNGSGRLEMIKSDRIIEQFASMGSNISNNIILCGLSQGRLYQVNGETSTANSWKWKLSDWAPSGITHISHSYDGNYLWIQSPISSSLILQTSNNIPSRRNVPFRKKLTQCGNLYRFIGMEESPVLVKQILLPWRIIRIYGRNDVCYLEINQITHRAIRYPKGDTIRNCHLGLLMPNGKVYKIGEGNNLKIRNIRLIREIPHLITHRQCASTFDNSIYDGPAIPPIPEVLELSSEWVT
uniref:Uncharacterized protein n=1 Tax=Pithovirus LCPAC202 TaxID=2506592 RepID=A0A481Z6A1_9VIRU|nr:MAG: uncharacterized protein LCPAC202_01100 [Pithovirus LCPAC202]